MDLKIPDADDIDRAAERIAPHVKPTPVLRSSALDEETGAELHFKMENLMEDVGAFKLRGAMNAVLSLTPEELRRGVITESSGNHGAALAKAARVVGVPCAVVVPRDAPEVKKGNMRRFGAVLHECEPTQDARRAMVAALQRETGAVLIHPFNDMRVVAGQATATRELLRQVPGLDAVIAPVGGGGLLSGTALAAHYYAPGTRVLAGEPEGADDAYRSLQTGVLQRNETVDTIADGLRTSLGDKTFPIIQRFVDQIVLVSNVEIISAMRQLWEQLRAIVEPSGAVAHAAVRKAKDKLAGRKIGVIVTGGNVDLERAFALMAGK